MALKLDGNAQAAIIKTELKARLEILRAQGLHPGLATVLVGNDPASLKYIEGKHRDCAEVGIRSIRRDLPEHIAPDELMSQVRSLNEDPACTGLIVQLPLPEGIDPSTVIESVDPLKDADGMHPYNLGELVLHTSGPIETPLPCTPRGIVELLSRYHIDLDGKEVCVLGRGLTVGRSIGLLLTRREVNATVTLCHTGTRHLDDKLKQADVIISAVGTAGFVRAEQVKPGAVLVDVGVSRVWDQAQNRWRIKGDIDPAARDTASAYTPNPGGVGPMTRAMLLLNVVEAAERSARSSR